MEGKEMVEHKVEVHPERCVGCMICLLRCSFKWTDSFNPLKANSEVIRVGGTKTSEIRFKDTCENCGYCTQFCIFGARTLKEEGGVA